MRSHNGQCHLQLPPEVLPIIGASVTADQHRLSYIQLCADTRCSLEDIPGVMDDRDWWLKGIRELCAARATWWYIYIYIYIHLLGPIYIYIYIYISIFFLTFHVNDIPFPLITFPWTNKFINWCLSYLRVKWNRMYWVTSYEDKKRTLSWSIIFRTRFIKFFSLLISW